jgi:hypothetical protein
MVPYDDDPGASMKQCARMFQREAGAPRDFGARRGDAPPSSAPVLTGVVGRASGFLSRLQHTATIGLVGAPSRRRFIQNTDRGSSLVQVLRRLPGYQDRNRHKMLDKILPRQLVLS